MSIAAGHARAPIMAAAKVVASDSTMVLPAPSLVVIPGAEDQKSRKATGDPLDDLVAHVRETASRTVDALQVAALLEADGITDRVARAVFGYADVFALADEVFHRAGGGVRRLRAVGAPLRDPARAAREITHGLLYLLPGALFPAVAAVIAPRPLLVALVLAGGLGWVWAAGATWLAYQCLNVGDERMAGRVLAWSTAAGLGVAALAGLVVALTVGGGVRAAALVPGVMAYQMASTALVFYHRELWLAALIAPAAATGLAYVTGAVALGWALAAVTAGVMAALAVGLVRSWRAGEGRTVSAIGGPRGLLRGRLRPLAWVLAYNLLAAAFLLHAQVPYLLNHIDVVLAGLALIVSMGIVEWRARRFIEEARRLLTRVRYPKEFHRRIWRLLMANIAVCWLVTALFATGLLTLLREYGRLTPAGTAMAGAQVAMAGAYLVAFVLAGHVRYGWLCASLAASIAVSLGGAFAAGADGPPGTVFYLTGAILLQILLLVGLAPVLGQVWRYR